MAEFVKLISLHRIEPYHYMKLSFKVGSIKYSATTTISLSKHLLDNNNRLRDTVTHGELLDALLNK